MATIRILAGVIGSGKTTLAMQEIVGRMRLEPKRLIATNIDVLPAFVEMCGGHYPEGRLLHLGHLTSAQMGRPMPDSETQVQKFYHYTPPGSLVYLDEATYHFDARHAVKNAKENPDFTRYLTHVRKYRDDVTFICQDEGHLDVRIRDLATSFCWCVSVRRVLLMVGFPFAQYLPEFFMVREYMDAGCKGHASTRWIRSSSYYWRLFDSYAVGTASDLRRLDDARAVVLDDRGCEIQRRRGGFSWWAVGAALLAAALLGLWL